MADAKVEQPADGGDSAKDEQAEAQATSELKDSVKAEEAPAKTEETANGAEAESETNGAAESKTEKAETEKPDSNPDSNTKTGDKAGAGQVEQDKKKPGTYQGKKSFKQRYRENNKFDPSTLETSKDPEEIRKQVEFYFSDSNLPMDKFLLAQTGGVENKPVSIKAIGNFKRMRHFQPYEAVVAALRDSTVLEVTEDEGVKRKVPIEQAALGKSIEEGQRWVEDKAMGRSIYAKGFGAETPTTQLDIESFFEPYGPTNAIRLRRTAHGVFKGSVFVEFGDEATKEKFMAIEAKPKWKDTTELMWLTKKAYVDGKAADIAAGRIKPGQRWAERKKNSSGDPDDWKKRRDEDQKRGSRDGNGRGRGGRRGGGRGRGGRHNGRAERDPHKVPTIATSTPESAGEVVAPKAKTPADANPEAAAPAENGSSKKRAREEEVEALPSAKKLDVRPEA
ncbi:MAG: hypothetical protein M1832_001942 [Thelocarpon impressellum]|nr:MAG: hypothetical protein M1832_001942 [Thelocarpon impressellum]